MKLYCQCVVVCVSCSSANRKSRTSTGKAGDVNLLKFESAESGPGIAGCSGAVVDGEGKEKEKGEGSDGEVSYCKQAYIIAAASFTQYANARLAEYGHSACTLSIYLCMYFFLFSSTMTILRRSMTWLLTMSSRWTTTTTSITTPQITTEMTISEEMEAEMTVKLLFEFLSEVMYIFRIQFLPKIIQSKLQM